MTSMLVERMAVAKMPYPWLTHRARGLVGPRLQAHCPLASTISRGRHLAPMSCLLVVVQRKLRIQQRLRTSSAYKLTTVAKHSVATL